MKTNQLQDGNRGKWMEYLLLGIFALLIAYCFFFRDFHFRSFNKYVVFEYTVLPFKKGMIPYMLTSFGLILGVIYQFFISKKKIVFDSFHWLLLGYLLWCFTTMLWSRNAMLSIGLYSIVLSIALFYYFSTILIDSQKQRLIQVLTWLLPILTILLLYNYFINNRGILEILAEGSQSRSYQSFIKKTKSYIGGKNLTSMFLMMLTPIYFFTILHSKRIVFFLNLLILFAGLLLVLVLGSRNTYLSLIVFMVVTLLFSRPNKRVIAIIVATLGVSFLVFFTFVDVDFFLQQLTRQNYNQRLRVWSTTLEIFQQSPFLGNGIGQWDAYRPPLNKFNFHHPHNDYLRQLSEVGIMGFILFYSLIALLIYRLGSLIKHATDDKEQLKLAVLLGGVVSYLVTSAIDEIYTKVNIMFMVVLVWAFTNDYYRRNFPNASRSLQVNNIAWLIVTALAVYLFSLNISRLT